MKKVISNCLYMYKKIWSYSKLRIILGFVLSIISTANLLVIIFFDKFIIDAVIAQKSIQYMLIIIGIRLGMLLISQCAENIFYNIIFRQCDLKIKEGFVKELYDKVKTIDLNEFDDPAFYDKFYRALNEADSRFINMLGSIEYFIKSVLQLIVLSFTLAYFSPFIILIAFIGMIVTVWANVVNAKKVFKVDMLQTRPNRYFDYIKRIFYMMQFSKDIKITNIKDILFKKYDEQVVLTKKIISKEWPPIATVAIAASWLFNFVVIGVSGMFIIFRISKNLMTIGDFVSVSHAVRELSGTMVEFSRIIPELTEHSLYIDNYLEVLNYKSKMLVNPSAISLSTIKQHSIILDNVSFLYKNSVNPVIKDLTLSIKAGEHIAIVGENGAGKSTLIKLITRLYDPVSGNISIDDVQYSDISKESLYGSFAIVLQDFQTYAFSLQENITLSDNSTAADIENINKILDIVDLKNLINELPNGYDTILTNELDDNGTNLSGGQLQRLAIARAIFQNTSIIIMDEPTSALDPINESRIFNIIDEICKDKTLILISHRLSGVKNMDKILYMENGQIMESGSHKELMDMNQKYCKMFRTQAERYRED